MFDTPLAVTATFVGETTLLVRCAELARNAGMTIVAIASRNPNVVAWADEHKITVVESADALAEQEADYLFSVGNLSKLPSRVVASARIKALNFHDGPLPAYAGLNVPVWALLNGETQHAVTWHEITDVIDAGRVVCTRALSIDPTDTVGTLNAKCFEAGTLAFEDVIAEIKRGALTLTAQAGERRIFKSDHRPPHAGLIDPAQGQADVLRLVRALDFGVHENPIGRPWFHVDQRCVQVDSAALVDISAASAGHAPGTIVAVEANGIVVTVGDGPLRLQGLRDHRGIPLSGTQAFAVGQRLTVPAALAAISAADAKMARSEATWVKRLAQIAPAEIAYPIQHHDGVGARHVLPLTTHRGGARSIDTIVAAFAGWLAMQSAAAAVSLRLRLPLGGDVDGIVRARSMPDRLLTITTNPDATGAAFLEHVNRVVETTGALAPMQADLVRRRSSPARALASPDSVSMLVALGDAGDLNHDVDIALLLDPSGGRPAQLSVSAARFDAAIAARMASHLESYAAALVDKPTTALRDIVFDTDTAIVAGPLLDIPKEGLGAAFANAALRWPDRVAVRHRDRALTYRQLQQRVDAMASRLEANTSVEGRFVGIAMSRGIDMLAAMLAVAQRGAAYVPLDPEFPADRVRFMIEDANLIGIFSDGSIEDLAGLSRAEVIDVATIAAGVPMGNATTAATPRAVAATSPAYMLFTSGSTGRPKGVVVTSENLANFFAAMDAPLATRDPVAWLALTSISFDISILELFWTVTRGGTVVFPSAHGKADADAGVSAATASSALPNLSLFYFASTDDGRDQPYRLLFEGAAFADANGFEAVWTPERHFHEFGGNYPNSALTSAALAGMTKRVALRAGSCVAPLHHPARIAEDWAVVDRLSGGRAGLAFASGWSERDFVLNPGHFNDRKDLMLETLAQVRRLWKGEAVPFPGPRNEPIAITTTPRPAKGDIPVWLTAAKAPETFQAAGRLGCNVLTHLLGMSFEEVQDNIRLYRRERQAAGHVGPGRVTLMLHTYVGATDAEAKARVREPMKSYLASSIDLIWKAAGSFPTLKPGTTGLQADFKALSSEEREALLEHAFNRYYETSGLFGAPETCRQVLEKAQRIGVDEVACLIDFGVPIDATLEALPRLASLKGMPTVRATAPSVQAPTTGLADDIARHAITHVQCTPSLATLLLEDAPTRAALQRVAHMMVGGEELTRDLAVGLRAALGGRLTNMYGPTETTIWSLTHEVSEVGDRVPIGVPIANTTLRIENGWGQTLPSPMAGELLIGGHGVAAGYHDRAALTAERFIARPAGTTDAHGTTRYYRTGDVVRRTSSGALSFLGRADNQVKVRGHRIELGEIEAALQAQPGVLQAAVVASMRGADVEISGFVVARTGGALLSGDALRAALSSTLPATMVPSRIVPLQRLPMTPNKKVDRPALLAQLQAHAGTAPATEPAASAVESDQPSTSTEQAVRAAWLEVLSLPNVGLDRNFFDVGGHSLLAIRLRKLLQERLGRDIDLVDVFRFPTIRQFTAQLSGQAPDAINAGMERAAARQRLRRAPVSAPTNVQPV